MEGPEKKTNLGPHISQNCCSVYLNPNVISMVSYCLDDMNPHNLFNHGNLFPSLLHPLSVSVFCLVRFERHYRLCCLSILCFYLRPWQCSGLRHGAVTNIYPSSWLWKADCGKLVEVFFLPTQPFPCWLALRETCLHLIIYIFSHHFHSEWMHSQSLSSF